MKHLLLSALLLAGLAGCQKKDEPTPTPSIVGAWKFVTEQVVATPVAGGSSTYGNQALATSDLLTLRANGLAYSSVNGQTSDAGTYVYTGSTLSITGISHAGNYGVKSLVATALVLTRTGSDGKFTYAVTDSLTRTL